MSIIEMCNVTYTYNPGTPYAKKALDSVSLSVNKGEFLGIVGSNGSGKSTLIQHLNGILYPQSGSVTVLGNDTRDNNDRKQLWKNVGLVFQFPEQQLFEATVYNELAYGLKNMGLDSPEIDFRIKEALAYVGLDSDQIINTSPFCLSGGMMRRVAIASILAMKPKILVLDEPTAGLDSTGSANILQTIKKFQRDNGVTVIMVSHCINELILLCDRIALMNHGKIFSCGSSREVLSQCKLSDFDMLLPDYIKMLFYLKEYGWNINTGVLTVKEAADEIGLMLKGRR